MLNTLCSREGSERYVSSPQAPARRNILMKCTVLLVATLLAVGCQQSPAEQSKSKADNSATNVPADNTGKNERDQNTLALTPGDQGGSESDRTLTQHVRQGVIENDTLSISAKNVKIITQDGVVTLRGPVKSSDERARIAAIAQHVDGVKRVDNQLEIAAN